MNGIGIPFGYDDDSNRLTKTTGGTTTTATYDAQDRLLTYGNAIYDYTPDGELKSKTDPTGTTTYDYDALGNLRKVVLPDGRIVEYVIDAQNRRVGKKINGILAKGWLYSNQLQIAAELDGGGTIISRFVYASRSNVPDFMIRGGVSFRILSDHLGRPRYVLDATTGAVIQSLDYDEFGRVLADTNPGFQPFGFAGGLLDYDTGLVRFGARDYDAETGRWTAKDPIGFAGGDTNLYGYTFNDPVNFIDREGNQAQSATTVAAETAVEVGAAAGVFVSNFAEMIWVWTIGVDKYYHCMANCQSARLGPVAEGVATGISDAREYYDQHHQGQSAQACAADQIANRAGRYSGRNQSCESACAQFRPAGFKPPKRPFFLTKPGFLP